MAERIAIAGACRVGVHRPIIVAYDGKGREWQLKGTDFRIDDPKCAETLERVRAAGSIDPARWAPYRCKRG